MSSIFFILMCLLSFAAGDISEKLKQGQGFSPPAQIGFQGLLAPFQDGQTNVNDGRQTGVKGGRPSGVKGGRPSGVKGGSGFRQLGAEGASPPQRVPIPFRNHDGDDDENNLDRLCNDAFHSFLCKPVGPRRRIDGKLRPGARIPSGVLTGSSSNVQISKQVPQQSGGALLPTELDDDEGYQYPKPTNNIPSTTGPGYSYPKPSYNYEKPSNQLAYPSQVSEAVQKPSNEYLPSFPETPSPSTTTPFPTTTYRPPTTPPLLFNNVRNFDSPTNQLPAQSNSQPVVFNQLFYQYPKPSNPISLPAASQSFPVINQPVTYTFPQTTFQPTQTIPLVTANSAVYTYSTPQPANPFFIPAVTQPQFIYSSYPSPTELSTQNEPQASNEDGYVYPKPSNDQPVILPVSAPQELPSGRGYLPPVGAPVPKESNIILDSLPALPSPSPPPFSPRVQTSRYTTPFPFPVSTSTPRPVTTTYRPVTVISTQPSTTIRPYTFETTQRPPLPPSTLRPFIYQTTSTTTSRPPIQFNFASSNEVPFPAPQPERPNNGYLPPQSQLIPSPANEFKNVLPFSQPPSTPRPTLPPPPPPRPTLPPPPPPPPRPTLPPPPPPPRPSLPPPPPPPPPPPSKKYLPQVEGASSNVSPNFEGGSLLADEADAPIPNIKPRTTERTHTHEEFCRDAFHSFLCKPIDTPRRRIDGKLRAGAKVPPHVKSLLEAASSTVNRKTRPNLSGGSLLPTELNPQLKPQLNPYQFNNQAFQSTNVNQRLVPAPAQQPLFVVSESDSSSLAKKFSQQHKIVAGNTNEIRNGDTKPLYRPPVTSTTPKLLSIPPSTRFATASTTTNRPTTSKLLVTTQRPVVRSTTSKITTTTPTKVSFKSPSGSGEQVQASSVDERGYKYPKPQNGLTYPSGSSSGYNYTKPSNPLNYPSTTSATGYDYPKPKKPFVFPTTPRTRPTPSRQFGQRVRTRKPDVNVRRPSQQQQQEQQQLQQQQQEQQSQFQEDPFGQNEVIDRANELPPASQFEILKP